MNKPTTKTLVPKLRFPEFRDAGEWERDTLTNLVSTVTSPKKLPSAVYQTEGKYPIIDQSQSYICGRTNDQDALISDDLPLIIFGDHTCALKIVNEPFAQGADGIKILKTKELTEIIYLYQYLQFNPVVMDGYKRHFSILKKKIVTFPKKESGEQQKIADCLSSIDELITAHSQKHEALKAHKKGLMQQLFPAEEKTTPKLRFPEFRDAGAWDIRPLKKVFLIFQGFAFSSKDSVTEGVRWLKIADVSIQQMNHSSPSYLPIKHREKHDRFSVKQGDYVLALTRPILSNQLKIAPVDEVFHGALLNQRVGKLMTTKNIAFVYFLLQTSQLISDIKKSISGSEPPNLSAQQIENIKTYIPSNKEQQKIADCLSSIDELITTQAHKINSLKAHKKGLMQQLFPAADEVNA